MASRSICPPSRTRRESGRRDTPPSWCSAATCPRTPARPGPPGWTRRPSSASPACRWCSRAIRSYSTGSPVRRRSIPRCTVHSTSRPASAGPSAAACPAGSGGAGTNAEGAADGAAGLIVIPSSAGISCASCGRRGRVRAGEPHRTGPPSSGLRGSDGRERFQRPPVRSPAAPWFPPGSTAVSRSSSAICSTPRRTRSMLSAPTESRMNWSHESP